MTLRSTFVEASVRLTRDVLLQGISLTRQIHPYRLETSSLVSHGPTRLVLLLQPVTARQTLVHAVLAGPVPADERLALQRSHTACFNALRDRIEQGARRPA